MECTNGKKQKWKKKSRNVAKCGISRIATCWYPILSSNSSIVLYKAFFSIVLMVVVNASYRFTLVNIGVYSRLSDGSVSSYSTQSK